MVQILPMFSHSFHIQCKKQYNAQTLVVWMKSFISGTEGKISAGALPVPDWCPLIRRDICA